MSRKSSPPRGGVIEAVARHNAGREPERLAMKYAKMAQNPFLFLRGACHLYYDTLPDARVLRKAPLAWCCGDLHFENFGSYKGDNRLVYFDINDFDEAALAPATWDIVRLLTSILCGADTHHATRAQALAACRACLGAYRSALVNGKPLWVEWETSTGLVRDLLTHLRALQRATFLDRRSLRSGRRRSLKLDGVKALPASKEQRQRVIRFMDRFAARQPNPGFYKVLDVGRRIAGTGSLGLARFVILVEGKGSPDGNYLIELKESRPSALLPHLKRLGIAQPKSSDEASRLVAAQGRMQAIDHAFLHAVKLDRLPCTFKELQPSEDRVEFGECSRKPELLKQAVATMGRVLAWDQLRAAGRSGAAGAEALIDFAERSRWTGELLEAAVTMAQTTRHQWKTFAEAHAQGELAATEQDAG